MAFDGLETLIGTYIGRPGCNRGSLGVVSLARNMQGTQDHDCVRERLSTINLQVWPRHMTTMY